MTNTQLIADLKATRERIARGWCPNGPLDDDGNVCILMAANRICGEMSRWYAIRQALNDHLPTGYSEVYKYNDAEHTTLQDMFDLIDKTLADLGGLA